MAEILSTLDGSGYVVRRSLHNAANIRKSKKAIRMAFEAQERGLGFSMVELLSSCPTNWKISAQESLEFVEKQMVPVFPLGDYKVTPELASLKI
jgi:2-oxoglutarate ferredoxin oxidoreductase subunit beta